MTVDIRAQIGTDLGINVSGGLSPNLISDKSGLQMYQGSLVYDGILNPARGTPLNILITCRQTNKITRFPFPLYVIRAVPNVIERYTDIEVGCRLSLMKDRKDQLIYTPSLYTPPGTRFVTPPNGAPVRVPIYAQKVVEFCLDKIGLQLDSSSHPLEFRFLRPEIDLSDGYIRIIGDLIRSECCFGRILPNGKFQIVPLNLNQGGSGPVLTASNLISIQPIVVGSEPVDNYIVTYNAAERRP